VHLYNVSVVIVVAAAALPVAFGSALVPLLRASVTPADETRSLGSEEDSQGICSLLRGHRFCHVGFLAPSWEPWSVLYAFPLSLNGDPDGPWRVDRHVGVRKRGSSCPLIDLVLCFSVKAEEKRLNTILAHRDGIVTDFCTLLAFRAPVSFAILRVAA